MWTPPSPAATPRASTLVDLRRGFVSKLAPATEHPRTPAHAPPASIFDLVRYPAPLGSNVAYVSPARADATRRPAIVWIAGGFEWGIDADSWDAEAPRSNDQTARAFREAGIVLMRPSLRGNNDNPGRVEMFLGEVDDVLAAIEFVAKRPDVDPTRVYLGGHSTGGTMALLAAECAPHVRAVFAFGAVASPKSQMARPPFDARDPREFDVRSPGAHVSEISAPTFIIEGANGNVMELPIFQRNKGSAPVHVIAVPGATHFTLLGPATEVIAKKILADAGATSTIEITSEELASAVSGGATGR